MIKMSELENKLRNIISEIGKFQYSEKELINLLERKECDLINDVGLDSVLIIQFVVEVELCFGIDFKLEELDVTLLRKYENIKKYIIDKVNANHKNCC